MKIIGTKEEIDNLVKNSNYDFNSVTFEILEMGSITDEEIDIWGKFSDYEKQIIKKQYASHQKGFFPNPHCALR